MKWSECKKAREWGGGSSKHFKYHLEEEFKLYNVTYRAIWQKQRVTREYKLREMARIMEVFGWFTYILSRPFSKWGQGMYI